MNSTTTTWSGYPLTRQIIAGTSISTIILVTIIGNVMVMIAFYRDRRIHSKVNNWYIVNMSVADFIVGAFTLILSVVWTLKGWWPFGETLCKIYLLVDTISTTVPVFTIICISLDRYWLLTKKLDYYKYATKSKAIGFIAFIWIFCILYYGVVTYAWIPVTGLAEYIDYAWNCELEATYNFPFQIFMIFLNFIFPLGVIGVLNFNVYLNIYQRSTEFVRSKTIPSSVKAKPDLSSSQAATESDISPAINAQESVPGIHDKQEMAAVASPQNEANKSEPNDQTNNNLDGKNDHTISNDSIKIGTAEISTISMSVHTNRNQKKGKFNKSSREKKRAEYNRHRKAAITLAVLVIVFTLCWLPYYVAALMGAFCETCVVPTPLWETVSYLLWANSMINPFLYAAMNIYFRENFIKFLGIKRCLRKCDQNSRLT